MWYILVAVALMANGNTESVTAAFATLAECESELGKNVTSITEYNAGPADIKVEKYAELCVRIHPAPQGRAI